MAQLEVKEFLDLANKLPIIDVRSPSEHLQGHIPMAKNIPLFDDAERAVVGTSYKIKGKKEAILEGLEIVGPKMASFVREAGKFAVGNKVLVHCWRGGMRSGSFAWLMNTAGIEAYTLKGGYKSYRKFAVDFFSGLDNLILLGGETGSGKTEILKDLCEAGEQVVDLEALAMHKGSSFGGLLGNEQPTNEQFQNNLLRELMRMDLSKRIWFEDESHSIGNIRIPDVLWFKMRAAPVVRLQVLKQDRVKRLVRDYGNIDRELLADGITRISKKLGGLEASKALEFLESNNLEQAAEICLFYYDKAYNTGLRHRVHDLIYNLNISEKTNESSLVQQVISLADNIFSSESA